MNLQECPLDEAIHIHDEVMLTESDKEMAYFAYLMTQYSLKAGLRKFGKVGASAAESERTQLHVMDTWTQEVHEVL